MTEEEFDTLEEGDTVYYYNNINATRVSTFTAALKKKKVDKIRYNKNGERYISLTPSGVVLKSLLHMFDTNKEKLLYRKMMAIKKAIREAKANKIKFTFDLDLVYRKLLQQKNLQKMIEFYPELII